VRATLQGARAAGVKILEDGRAQATRGILREGRPSPAGTHGENRAADSRLREIMTTLGVKIGANSSCTTLPGTRLRLFAAFYDGYTGDRSNAMAGFL
jgi:hypothetical protein